MASQPNLRSTYCLFLRRENSTLLPSSWSCSPSTYHCLRVSLASTGGRRKFCSGSKQIKNSKAMPFYFPALIVQRVDQRLYQIMQWNHCNFENYELQMLDMPTKIKDQKRHSHASIKMLVCLPLNSLSFHRYSSRLVSYISSVNNFN